MSDVERLLLWLIGLESGILALDDVSTELDQIFLTREKPPPVFAGVSFGLWKGYSCALDTLREALRELHTDPRAPASASVRHALIGRMRARWESGAWDLEDILYALARLDGEGSEYDTLADTYHLVGEGLWDELQDKILLTLYADSSVEETTC